MKDLREYDDAIDQAVRDLMAAREAVGRPVTEEQAKKLILEMMGPETIN